MDHPLQRSTTNFSASGYFTDASETDEKDVSMFYMRDEEDCSLSNFVEQQREQQQQQQPRYAKSKANGDSDDNANRQSKWKFRKLLFESEIHEFLNSKVHDDPFARSSLPYALRFRGSIFWKLLPQLFVVLSWGVIITTVSKLKHSLGVSSILITMLGFVTGLSLSFRINTAYERYNEGRKYWAQLHGSARSFARFVWFQLPVRAGFEKQDTMAKITCLRLVTGFSIALKHHLREELGTDYDDLKPYVRYLPTYARKRSELAEFEAKRKIQRRQTDELELERLATASEILQASGAVSQQQQQQQQQQQSSFSKPELKRSRSTSLHRTNTNLLSGDLRAIINQSLQSWFPANPKLYEYLADRDDRLSRATIIHGNLPLEIIQFLGYYVRELQREQGMLTPSDLTFFYAQINNFTDVLTGTERILRTPLPLAYNILCNQLAWIFVLALPFQLVPTLEWVAIPATFIAGYVILGLAAIGLEIENPFGFDPNDLDLDRYCQNISVEIAMVLSNVPYKNSIEWMDSPLNKPLAPVFDGSFKTCMDNLAVSDMHRILQQSIDDPSLRFKLKSSPTSTNVSKTGSESVKESLTVESQSEKLSGVATATSSNKNPSPSNALEPSVSKSLSKRRATKLTQTIFEHDEDGVVQDSPISPISIKINTIPPTPPILVSGNKKLGSQTDSTSDTTRTLVDGDAEFEQEFEEAEQSVPSLLSNTSEKDAEEIFSSLANARMI
ncbi:Bestrophin, RFP-TM, chloride channel-domain-containing protein [Lipomyces japonicus]|uniref:Bestrophin, RFP-TM, chloride channel-domain-containing protein n=1 Tax=Lipomyces japonicus TaxID=56871 RepID=UPI0034CE67AE